MDIQEPDQITSTRPIWNLAFRAGFLLAATFAVFGMLRWVAWMTWPQVWSAELTPNWWHAHEMIFGFALPVIAGFLLTAVATWTGIAGTRGRRLQLLFGCWLLARLILWLTPQQHWLAWAFDTLFVAIATFELTRRVWAKRQWRNMLFPPLLLALALFDTAGHAAVREPLTSLQLHYGALWMVVAFATIIGGRIIPFFTGNRLGEKIPPLPTWFDYLALGSIVVIGLLNVLIPAPDTPIWLQGLYLAACAIHLYRLSQWRGWKTTRIPLLWSLHLSYLCLPLALAALALAGTDLIAGKHAMHLLAIGTVGGLILAMMARVSLGHTGRPLEVPGYIAIAFALIIIAAFLRALLPWAAPELTLWAWKISAALWIAAFGLFLFRYLPILTSPRADGKPG